MNMRLVMRIVFWYTTLVWAGHPLATGIDWCIYWLLVGSPFLLCEVWLVADKRLAPGSSPVGGAALLLLGVVMIARIPEATFLHTLPAIVEGYVAPGTKELEILIPAGLLIYASYRLSFSRTATR
jgi:hypothetical protein